MDHSNPQTSLGFTPDLYPQGVHMCYLYYDEEERKRVISAYLRSGLEQNEAVSYFPDTHAPDMLGYALNQLGVPPPVHEQPNQYQVRSAVEAYCPDGHFDPQRMVDYLRQLYQQGIAAGFSGTRMGGEMTWALRGLPGAERLVEYEAMLNKLAAHDPLTMICQYNTNKFDGATIFDILNVHPMMIVRGRVIQNPYFVPVDDYLKTKRGDHTEK